MATTSRDFTLNELRVDPTGRSAEQPRRQPPDYKVAIWTPALTH